MYLNFYLTCNRHEKYVRAYTQKCVYTFIFLNYAVQSLRALMFWVTFITSFSPGNILESEMNFLR